LGLFFSISNRSYATSQAANSGHTENNLSKPNPDPAVIIDTYNSRVIDIPNDTDFVEQWGLNKIQALQAWTITHGVKSVKIAILDSGIDPDHFDLIGKIVVRQNFSDSFYYQDKYGHGTHVAGIAAATPGNNTGIAGIGYDSSLMNIKVLGDKGNGDFAWIIRGIIWAVDHGANVINLSLASDTDSAEMKEAIDYAWNKGAVIVVAAGNGGKSDPVYPAAYPNCIAVTATDSHDQLYPFANYGRWVSVAAPGSSFSTVPGGNYETLDGTSMAASYVSGLAGLAFSVAKDKNGNKKVNDEVRTAILNNCDNIGVDGTGKGRINAYKTIISLTTPSTRNP
jgi:thermitase